MRYALIENNFVKNIIELSPNNIADFKNIYPIKDLPVFIGDSFENNTFYHNGVKVLSESDQLRLIINELDNALLDVTYENIIGGLE